MPVAASSPVSSRTVEEMLKVGTVHAFGEVLVINYSRRLADSQGEYRAP